jgi:adenosine kinase
VGHAREAPLASVGLSREDWVVISPTDPEAMMRHTQECRVQGVPYIFDPGKQTPRLDAGQIRWGIEGCRVLVGNDYEFGMMARTLGLSEQALIDLAPLTVMTRGEEGSRLYARGKPPLEIPVATPSAVVDPTGAGDAYLAGLAHGLARDLPLELTGRIAALAATYCIEQRGCQEHRFELPDFRARYQATFGQALPASAV